MDKVRWLLRALVTAALALPLLALVAPHARAESGGLVDVALTTITTPVIDPAQPDQVVEIRGTITNTSTSRVQYTAVNFWKSTTPILDGAALQTALAAPASVPLGDRQQPFTVESGHIQRINEGDWFAPGGRAEFAVSATVGELGFAVTDAAYFVGVHVRGIVEGWKGNQTVGRGRIVVAATASPIPWIPVVELTAGPHRTADGDFTDDTLARSLTEELDDLVAFAGDAGATVLLDPMLLMDVRALAQPHTVKGVASPPDPTAAQWAERVEALIADGRVMRLPWADVNLPRAQATGHLEDSVQWADDSLTDPALRRLPLAAHLDHFATPDLVRTLGRLGFTTVVAGNTAGGSIGPVRVIGLSPLRDKHAPSGSATAAQQLARRIAGELLSPAPVAHLVTSAEDVSHAADLPSHRRVVDIAPDETAATFAVDDRPPVWEELTTAIEALLSEASFRAELTGSDDLPQLHRLAAMSLSGHFDTQGAALDWLAATRPPELDPDLVTVSAAHSFVMGSRSNEFPVTLTNALEVPVTLRLVFESESPRRITVPATDFARLEPGQTQTLTLTPQATTNGVVTVHGHMETTDGTRFGTPVVIDITSTELGRVGWIIIIVSGAVVLGGTVWRIRAVQAEQKENA